MSAVLFWVLLPNTAYTQYTESIQTWTATTSDTWETKDLGALPFNVPANAVVEVAVRNFDSNDELWGGVRAVGSRLDRRFQLREPDGAGQDTGSDVVVMHVQTDASSRIQHYSDVPAEVDFVLLGYWTSGIYVERFDTFTAGADASWEDHDLSSFGVGAGQVAEIVMTNSLLLGARVAGVRANGSSLERSVIIHEPFAGGVDAATMFVNADPTANATIEIFAEIDADVDFYLVGFWGVAPLAYTELFTDVGSPSTDATW